MEIKGESEKKVKRAKNGGIFRKGRSNAIKQRKLQLEMKKIKRRQINSKKIDLQGKEKEEIHIFKSLDLLVSLSP